MQERDLIHDWNAAPGAFDWSACGVELNDETLRDGLQCPSVTDPDIESKKQLLHLMVALGIASADIGLPGAGPRAVADTLALAREIVAAKLPLSPNCAARTTRSDVEPVVRISQTAGIPIECATFIGSSPIRQYAEDWTLDDLLRASETAVTFAVNEGLPVMFVTEDTTRAAPDTLKALYGNAIRWGARRLCLADTVGHATPDGVRALVRFVKNEIIAPSGETVKLDWHGHRDRGFGLANCFAAIEAGADRVHGTALGVGERVGQRGDGPAADQSQSARRAQTRPEPAAGVRAPRVARPGARYPTRLSGARRGCVPHRHRRARGRDHQGAQEGTCVARGPDLLGRAGRRFRIVAKDRGLARIGTLEREVVARGARSRCDERGALPASARRGEIHAPHPARQ